MPSNGIGRSVRLYHSNRYDERSLMASSTRLVRGLKELILKPASIQKLAPAAVMRRAVRRSASKRETRWPHFENRQNVVRQRASRSLPQLPSNAPLIVENFLNTLRTNRLQKRYRPPTLSTTLYCRGTRLPGNKRRPTL